MICGLRGFLEKEIKPTKGATPRLELRFKYATSTGAKLLAYASSSVQEVFVVTKDTEALKSKLASLFE
jgi:hypothetical protein